MTVRDWLSASKGNEGLKSVKYSEETYLQIHNLLLGDSEDETTSDLVDAGTDPGQFRHTSESSVANTLTTDRLNVQYMSILPLVTYYFNGNHEINYGNLFN